MGDDTWAGVIEVACVMAAVGIHVIDVVFGADVRVEELKVGKGL
jgi:hypothetical protein